MKFYPVIPYSRPTDSLFHYPETSAVTGKKIDWMYDTPTSGFEALDTYGRNTIEVKGLPMGATPEYVQERLRRFYSKFGPVTVCRALNHPLDPYQCEGTAYISFREETCCERAAVSVLRFGSRKLGNKVLDVRILLSDKALRGKESIAALARTNDSLVRISSKLFEELLKIGPCELSFLPLTESEVSVILSSYGSLVDYCKHLRSLFVLSEDGKLLARRLINSQVELRKLKSSLSRGLDDSLSVHWRAGKPLNQLPEYTQRRVDLWDKKDKLPFDLQILSRDYRQYRVHDEKFLIASRKKREKAQMRAENRKAAIARRNSISE